MNKSVLYLIEQINNCPVNFNPLHDHHHGTEQPEKVVFVPVFLIEEIKTVIQSYNRQE